MSGIVGIFNLDRAPVDRGLLGRMTAFMTFRGPDAQETWIDSDGGHVGFGHTLLKTTFEAEHERQPLTLDGRVWIVADARVDAQRDLIAKLAARGDEVALGATDVELILRAYRIWGEDCVDHLLGDFAFAIWDARRDRLFCARDHLGVKPFFYAHLGSTVIFSNTLDCIRQHPAVSDKLNDLAIADFLLFGSNQEKYTTSFAEIQRIPPAHTAAWSRGQLNIRRYWTLPIDQTVYFKRADDYTDRFKELLGVSVGDRLRTNCVGVFMSGGLDSTTLAATAHALLTSQGSGAKLVATTNVYDGFDRNEKLYAAMVASHLGIPTRVRNLTGRTVASGWDLSEVHTSEPVRNPYNLIAERQESQILASSSRVWFFGEGPDNALQYEWKAHLSGLLRQRKFGRVGKDVFNHILLHKRIPLISSLPHMIREWRRGEWWRLPYPTWIEQNFESRLQLKTRWTHILSNPPEVRHPLRPAGHHSFNSLNWEPLFRGLDAEEMNAPLEIRHPFLDLSLLRFMLSVPALPWCRSKYLLRRAMRGLLPEGVLRRPKSPLSSDPEWADARVSGLPALRPSRGLQSFVNSKLVPREIDGDRMAFRVNFRPRALNYWLANLSTASPYTYKEEMRDEFLSRRGR